MSIPISSRYSAAPTPGEYRASPGPAAKKQKTIHVTSPDFFDNALNLDSLAETFGVTKEDFREALLANVRSSSPLSFSAVTVEDLELYRTIGHIAIEPEDLKKLKAEGDAVLAQYDSFRKRIQAVVWARNEAGCRILIDTVVVPAVYRAEELQSEDPIVIVADGQEIRTAKNDHIVLVAEYASTLDLNGPVDYAIVVVNDHQYKQIISRRSPLPPRDHSCLLTLLEAKTPVTLASARGQIEAQCLAMLKATCRALFFAGVLTDGIRWVFFLAAGNEKGLSVYESEMFDHEFDEGLIVAILVALIRTPGTVPDFFKLAI
ncbi:hypothetical protein B0H14DRAFT_2839180 [Mycena olivaceomarginata]|nr:hypothetical protein B0H14DRAFT_2839180 [Mycena olivaceomarginata]